MVPVHNASPGFQSDCRWRRRVFALAREAHLDGAVLAPDFEPVFGFAEPDRALAFARHARPVHLAGYRRLRSPSTWSIAAATAASTCARSPSGACGVEAVGKFLGDEAGRQLAGAPTRMRHQRREERNIVADAVDDEGVERVGLRVDRLGARAARG